MDVKTEADSSQAKTLENEFRKLADLIKFFKDCYDESKYLINQIESVFQNDYNQANPCSIFFTGDEKVKLEEFCTKRASVLVIGQTNSGKSSLINELLGSSYLPTSEIPCTSRIVRIRYSEENVVTVRESTGELKIQPTGFKKAIPKAEIVLEDDSKRGDKQWTQCTVEVGLRNPLLQGGYLEFVDAPGISENEVLDALVHECIHGILQVLIYVIDGNSSLRTQDREFLYYLKGKIGAVPIFFVCNKIDVDKKAAEFDRDDDELEDYLDAENQLKIMREKKVRIFSALSRSQIIDIDPQVDDVDDCDFFHGVSTREVRKARRNSKSNVLVQHVSSFDRMKRCFLKFASESITSNVTKVSGLLQGILQRIFDLCVCRPLTNMQSSEMKKVVHKIKFKENDCFEKMRQYILDNTDRIQSILSKDIINTEDKILSEAEEMEFAPIVIADVVHRNEIINQYKGQIQKMVLMATVNISLKSAMKTVKTVSSNVREQLHRCLEEGAKKGGITGRLIKQQLRHGDVLTNAFSANDFINMAVVKDYTLMSSMYKVTEPTKSFIADVVSVFKGTTVDKAWKRKIAKNVLDNVDRSKLAERIIGALLDNLHVGHYTFTTNMKCIEQISEKAESQTKSQEQAVSQYASPFAGVLCRNDALLESLKNPHFHLEDQIGKGMRGTVYGCYSSGAFSGKELVAKKFHPEILQNTVYLAIQHALKRLDGGHPSIMRPVQLTLIDSEMMLLLPRMHTTLYLALSELSLFSDDHVTVRLAIFKQVASACKFCRASGLQLIDPRITNVLLDEQLQAKLNISKPRDDDICYPDDLAPFHVCAPPPLLVHTSKRVLEIAASHDVYALGVMGWLLALGRYQRPIYANTNDVSKIYESVMRGTSPDPSEIPEHIEEANFAYFVQLVYDCLNDVNPSLIEVEQRLEEIRLGGDNH